MRPAVDILMKSIAQIFGINSLGVILTGMGADGAKGLLKMNKVRAFTMAQDEESSVVFGMPNEAIEIGAASRILSLDKIPNALISKFGSVA